jgi:hypothetical protein
MRRWLHEIGWVWKRPKLAAKDDDPPRVTRLARIRWVFEPLKPCEAIVLADALDLHVLPKVGCAWMPKGSQLAVMTPGQNQKPYLAGAIDPATWMLHHGVGPRNTKARFRELRGLLEGHDPAERYTRVYVVVDHAKSHKATAVEPWLAAHPRLTRLFWPTYCLQANPIERVFGDVHDLCPRNHTRRRVCDLVADVEEHLHVNGPWRYKLADIYDEPAVTAAVEHMIAEELSQSAA